MTGELLTQVLCGKTLTPEEAYQLMQGMMEGAFTPAQMGALLATLRLRGETREELLGFARAMKDRAMVFRIPSSWEVADNCGTGGDGKGTLNISTGAALLAHALGVPVVKHGNRSVSSRCGSADFLEGLGFPIDLPQSIMEELFARTKFAFLFAPLYHPAMRAVQGVRRELGVRTTFNLLGPLTTPCPVHYKMVGVYSLELLEPVAYVLLHLGVERGLVVFGEPGVDEVSVCGTTHCVLVTSQKIERFVFHPEEVGLPVYPLSAIQGGEPQENVFLFLEVLEGRVRKAPRDALALNAAFLLWLSKKAESVPEALGKVGEAIDSGRALENLKALLEEAGKLRRGEGHGSHS